MGLIGSCDDCGRTANLRHKPDVPMSEQSPPSVCDECYHRREEMMHDARDRSVPAHVDPVPYEFQDGGDA